MSNLVPYFESIDGRHMLGNLPRMIADDMPNATQTYHVSPQFAGLVAGTEPNPLYNTVGTFAGTWYVHPGTYDQAVVVPAGNVLVCAPGVTFRPPSGSTWGVDCEGSILGYPTIDMSNAGAFDQALRIKGTAAVRVEVNTSNHAQGKIRIQDSCNVTLDVGFASEVNVVGSGRVVLTARRLERNFTIDSGVTLATIASLGSGMTVAGGTNYLTIHQGTGDWIGTITGGTTTLNGLRVDSAGTSGVMQINGSSIVTMNDCHLRNSNTSSGARWALTIEAASGCRVRLDNCRFMSARTSVVLIGSLGACLMQGCTIVNEATTLSPVYGVEFTTAYVTRTFMARDSHVIIKSSGATRHGFFANNAKNITGAGSLFVTHAANANVTWDGTAPTTLTNGLVEV